MGLAFGHLLLDGLSACKPPWSLCSAFIRPACNSRADFACSFSAPLDFVTRIQIRNFSGFLAKIQDYQYVLALNWRTLVEVFRSLVAHSSVKGVGCDFAQPTILFLLQSSQFLNIINRMLANVMNRLLLVAVFCSVPTGIAWADGAVYAMTNALGSNQVMVYHRASNGTLTLVQTIATGGGGSGLQLAGVDSLGSAGSLQLDAGHNLLFAVNTESASANNGAGAYNTDCQQGTITSFRVSSNGMLTFADRVSSGGLFPNSLTVETLSKSNQGGNDDEKGNGKGNGNGNGKGGDLLYVLNAGGPGACNLSPNVTGFHVGANGQMQAVTAAQDIFPGLPAGAGQDCSAASAAGFAALTGAPAADFACGLNPPSFSRSPGQVQFTPDGQQVIVTVKGTNSIYAFPLDSTGRAGSPTITTASLPSLPSYFGFTFDKNANLLVTELFGAATSIPAGAMGSVSSFSLANTGSLQSISSHVGDGGTAASVIALEPATGKYAYVSNNLSASIASYSVGTDGSVTLLDGSAAVGAGPLDLATATEGGASYLYVLLAGTGTVGAFQVNLASGSLTAITGGSGLPTPAAQGLAAF